MAGAVDDIVVNTGENQVAKYAMLGGLILLFGAIAYYGIVSPILETVGIKESKEDEQAKRLILEARNSGKWSPSYYNVVRGGITNSTKFVELAKLINNSWGLFNDNEQQIYNQFSQLKNADELSYLAYKYYDLTKSDLLGDIDSNLSSSEKIQILTITEKLK